MQWVKRLGYGALRRVRIIQGFFRFYGGKVRQQWQSLGTGWRGGLARIALLGVVAAVAWSLWTAAGVLSGVLMAGRTPDPLLPIASGMGDEVHPQFDDEPELNIPAATAPQSRSAAARDRQSIAADEIQRQPMPPLSETRQPAGQLDQIALPVAGTMGQTSGWRRHVEHGHWYYEPGVELVVDGDVTVNAVLPGSVAHIGPASSPYTGFTVVIDHGQGLRTEYKSLTDVYVVRGQFVSARAPIGRAHASVVFAAFQDDKPLDTPRILAEY